MTLFDLSPCLDRAILWASELEMSMSWVIGHLCGFVLILSFVLITFVTSF